MNVLFASETVNILLSPLVREQCLCRFHQSGALYIVPSHHDQSAHIPVVCHQAYVSNHEASKHNFFTLLIVRLSFLTVGMYPTFGYRGGDGGGGGSKLAL